jgi:hypothetical protein
VTWSIKPDDGSAADAGTIDAATGLYTVAPTATETTVTVIASSKTGSAKSGAATVHVK